MTLNRMGAAVAALLLTLCVTAEPTQADQRWPNWRGPSNNGVAPAGKYPVQWSLKDKKNVLWTVPMESRAGSTPAVWEDKIFITTAVGGKNQIQAYNWQGEKLWSIDAGEEKPGKHKKGSGSNPSPLSDGKHVFAYFKSGDLVCVDFEGKIVWHKNLQSEFGEDTLWWDLGTSPILTKGHLIVACVQSGPSYVAAFDKQSGELAWKVDRMLDAPEEANQTYSTPVVFQHQGQEMIAVLGADHVTAHEALTGKEVWRVGGFNEEQNKYGRSIASPVISDDILLAPYDRGTTLTAISLDGKRLWHHAEISSDVPTPAATQGTAYVLNDQGKLAAVELKSGKVVWSVDTGKNRNAFSASPIVVGHLVYVTREDGVTFVCDTKTQKIIATNDLNDEFTVSTPVFANQRILIRSADHLICLGAN